MTTGQRLRELRKKKGLTQTEIGEIIGLSYSAISAIEQDRSEITSNALKKIAEFFKVSADYLLSGKESTGEISDDEREVLNAMREDMAFKRVAIEAAKAKKKVIESIQQFRYKKVA